jgi:hypothetical protein
MVELTPETIRDNFERVCERIERAAGAARRATGAVKLIVVSKGHSSEAVRAVVAAGARRLGENYVEEALLKIDAVHVPELEWHMIGHIQSRKARPVCERFDWVQSLDSLKLAQRLDQFAGELGRSLPVLLECNVSGEASKFGFPLWDEARWPEFLQVAAALMALPHLQIRGLMAMPPFDPEAEAARPHFQRLRRLQAFLASQVPQADWSELSMGMSGDFEIAVQEGATMVRVGTAIVGARPA